MNNKSHSPVTEMLSGKYKIWLMVGLGVLFVVDLAAWAVLIASGVSASYGVIPCFAAVIDLLYIVYVALSNQRFKYARALFVIYVCVSIILCLAWLIQAFAGKQSIYDHAIATMWMIFHVCGIAAVILTYIYAARLIRGGRIFQLVMAIALSCVAVGGSGIYYGIYLIKDGYFGQGNQNLALIYTCYGDDTCEVSGVIDGKGDSVVVPYEFNGYKVIRVSGKLLKKGINTVTLNCAADTTLFYYDLDDIPSDELNPNVVINVDKSNIDAVKSSLYGRNNTRDIGNRLFPIGLDDDQVYITFDYDYRAVSYAGGHLIPTWIGKKGDVFDLSEYEDLQYVQHSDINSDDDLNYCYGRYGNIMGELKSDGIPIDGMPVENNRSNVKVRFQKVYKIFAGASNDSMYEPADYFKCSTVDGVQLDYKLTVAENADKILDCFDRGEGFKRVMYYQTNLGNEVIISLEDSLQAHQASDVTIAPHWELVSPTVTVKPTGGSTDVIYGNPFSLEAEIDHPLLDEMQVSYEWYDSTQRISYDPTLNIAKASVVGPAEYMVTVHMSAPEITSLTTANADNIYMNVTRRPLTVTWTMKDADNPFEDDGNQHYGKESVYDGKERYVIPKANNAVEGDYVMFIGSRAINAGTYTDWATLSTANAEKYYIAEGESYTYTILPCPVPLTWSEQREFEYDGYSHVPIPRAYDLFGEMLSVVYYGSRVNAGEYTATAQISDTNYTIDDTSKKSVDFRITPKQVEVIWGDTELIYSGQLQAPEATAIGVQGQKVNLTVTGGRLHTNLSGDSVKEVYTAVASSADGNYTVDPATASVEFTIAPYTLTVDWGNTTLTYNGSAQVPTATAIGANGRVITLNVYAIDGLADIDAVAVGDYTAWADSGIIDYRCTHDKCAFTIKKKTIEVSVGDITAEYGQTPHYAPVVSGVVDGDDVTVKCSVEYTPDENGNIPVDTYSIKVELTGADIGNYTVSVVRQGTLTVTAAEQSEGE